MNANTYRAGVGRAGIAVVAGLEASRRSDSSLESDLRVDVHVDVTCHIRAHHCSALPDLQSPIGHQHYTMDIQVVAQGRGLGRVCQRAAAAVVAGNFDAQVTRRQGYSGSGPDPRAIKCAKPSCHANLHRRQGLDPCLIVDLERSQVIHAALQTQHPTIADAYDAVAAGRSDCRGRCVHRQGRVSRRNRSGRREGGHGQGERISVLVVAALVRELVDLHVPHARPVLQQYPIPDHVVGRADLNVACQSQLVAVDEEWTCARHPHAHVAARDDHPVPQRGTVLGICRKTGGLRIRVQLGARHGPVGFRILPRAPSHSNGVHCDRYREHRPDLRREIGAQPTTTVPHV